MAKLWAHQIISSYKGNTSIIKTFADVPTGLVERVKAELILQGYGDLAE